MPLGVRREIVTVAEEFRRNPDLKQEDLDELRQWLRSLKHLPDVSDQLLIRFHHSCYYEITNTKKCIETYHNLRSNTPEIFSNREITKSPLAEHSSSIHVCALPGHDNNGSRLFYYGLREHEPSKYNMYAHMKLFLMFFDLFSYQNGTVPGMVLIVNMEGMRLGHLAKFSLLGWKRCLQYLQEGNPIRLKKIHVVNVIPFIDKMMALLKPFMDKQFYNLIQFHMAGMDAFHEEVPRKYLPKEIGGSLESVEVYNAETIQSLAANADYFIEEEKLRIDETKREKRRGSKQSKSVPEAEFRFARLEID